jgi:hypothetical protein
MRASGLGWIAVLAAKRHCKSGLLSRAVAPMVKDLNELLPKSISPEFNKIEAMIGTEVCAVTFFKHIAKSTMLSDFYVGQYIFGAFTGLVATIEGKFRKDVLVQATAISTINVISREFSVSGDEALTASRAAMSASGNGMTFAIRDGVLDAASMLTDNVVRGRLCAHFGLDFDRVAPDSARDFWSYLKAHERAVSLIDRFPDLGR